MEINQIREALVALPRASNGKLTRVPDTLRAEILRAGSNYDKGMDGFASEIGISYSTILGWRQLSLKKAAKKISPNLFRRLEIKAEPPPLGNLFAVEGPRGLKVTGLSIVQLGMLFREVSQ